ncbi:MAG: OsmC family protein [Gemmatimonadaceae bacterium]
MSKRNHVIATWTGGHAFRGGRPNGLHIDIDGDAVKGPGPVDTLLLALASCTSYDIVEILAKRKTPAESLDIDVVGDRAPETPAKLTRIHLTYTLKGEGIDREHAERAIDLSINKYCSVKESLNQNIVFEWTLVLNT